MLVKHGLYYVKLGAKCTLERIFGQLLVHSGFVLPKDEAVAHLLAAFITSDSFMHVPLVSHEDDMCREASRTHVAMERRDLLMLALDMFDIVLFVDECLGTMLTHFLCSLLLWCGPLGRMEFFNMVFQRVGIGVRFGALVTDVSGSFARKVKRSRLLVHEVVMHP